MEVNKSRDTVPPEEDLEISYVHGACSEPLVARTVGWLLDEASRCRADLPAFTFPLYGQTLTYAELASQTNKVARGLLALGVEKGDRIVVIGFNGADWLTVYLAGASIGAIYTGPYLYKPKTRLFQNILEKLECSVVVLLGPEITENLQILRSCVDDASLSEGHKIQSTKYPWLKYLITADGSEETMSLSECIQRGSDISDTQLNEAKSMVNPDDGLMILCSTGTTGAPKFPLWNHFAAVNNTHIERIRINLYTENTVLSTQSPQDDDIYPVFHVVMTLLTCKLNTRMVILPDLCLTNIEEDRNNYLQTLQDYRVNVLWFYPHIWMMCFLQNNDIDKYDLTNLRKGVTAGWKVQPSVALPLIQKVPGFVVSLSASEYFPITLNFPEDELEMKCRTVGYVTPHTQIKLVDEKGRSVPVGEIGEVYVRGPAIFSFYWGEPELTSKAKDVAGWYHTGDLAKMDRSGFFTFIGRKVDCIRFKSWGDIVYPGYIEDVTRTMECIAEAKVVGLPNNFKGDDICLCVVMKPGYSFAENEISNHLKNQLLRKDFPDYILQFESFPKIGARKKIPKRVIEEMVMQRLKALNRHTRQNYHE